MKNLSRKIVNITILLLVVASCRKNDDSDIILPNDKADIISYSIVGKQAVISIDNINKTVSVKLAENVISGTNLVAEFTLSKGAKAYISNVLQVSKQSENNFETLFSYNVIAENGNITEWEIIATNNTVTLPWGLGTFQQLAKLNNKPYNYYIDQINTGTYAALNCGPTATTMAARWADPSYTKTPEDARAAYRPTGGWWYTSDIHNWLLNNDIPHLFISLSSDVSSTQVILKEKLDSGKIVILCVDMDEIRNGPSDDRRIDKFYSTSPGWGHFLVVKGYRKVNGIFFFEFYDPNSWGAKYTSGELKGLDRYYRTEDIYAIVIYEKGTKSISSIQDISSIPIAWGR
jgi:hypothetical protein